ncbi:VOC family protein, partial [Deinococcus sp. 14RED07]
MRILETCLYVDDLDRAEQFYTQLLGLTLHSRVPGRHLFYRLDGSMLLIFDPRASAQPG